MPKFAVAIHDLALDTHIIKVVDAVDETINPVVVAVSAYLREIPDDYNEDFTVEQAVAEIHNSAAQDLPSLLSELDLDVAVLEI